MNSLRFIFIFVLISNLFPGWSCRQKEELLNFKSVILNTDDCFPQRKIVELITNEKGQIINIADQWLIQSDVGDSRYLVCNIPETLKAHGLKLIFDAEIKEIFPNERWIGTPSLLKKALKLNN